MWELYLASNQSSRAPSMHTVGRSSCKISKTKKCGDEERAMVRFRGARQKGSMAFVECLGVSQENNVEAPLWRETLAGAWSRMTLRKLLVGCVMAIVAGKELPPSTPYLAQKTGWSSLSHNRVLHQALARSLRESKVQFVVEDTWPFRQRASEQNGRLNPLRMDITTEAGALFDNHPRFKNKALLLVHPRKRLRGVRDVQI